MNNKFEKGISVIIPVYNAEKYLPVCIDSLFSQSFRKNLEYLFVLDIKSSDSSEKILEKAVKNMPNAKIIKPKDGFSQGYNRNTALQYVSKDYTGFCDDDDWQDLDFYERLYDFAQIYNADIAAGWTILYNEQTKRIFNKSEQPFSIEYLPGRTLKKFKWNTVWDKIYRTEMVLNNADIRFAEGIIHEDNIFLINAVYHANKTITVPGSYYYWRRYPSSPSSIPPESEKYINDAAAAFNQILDSLEKMELPGFEKAVIVNQIMNWAKYAFSAGQDIRDNLLARLKKITGAGRQNNLP